METETWTGKASDDDAWSPTYADQMVEASFIEDKTCPYPVLQTSNGLRMTLESALVNYDVVDASAEERRVLARFGHPFGGVQ